MPTAATIIAQTPYLETSQMMGRVVGGILILLVVLLVLRATGITGKKKE